MTLVNSRLVRMFAASLLTGVFSGVVGGLFRLLLVNADRLRDELIAWAHTSPQLGWLAPVALGLIGAALARLMVIRFSPEAEGSGVQRVEAVFNGEVNPAGYAILPVKFFGGILAIGSGLALGREGPTVQMGASLGSLVSRFLHNHDEDARIVDAAGAGAGLGVAFNAPIAGALFVFEELTLSFTPWLLLATLAAVAPAVWTMQQMLGNHLDFAVKQISLTAVWKVRPFIVLGTLVGVIGTLYNWTIAGLLRFADNFSGLTSVTRTALIGATIGLAGVFAPMLIGGGDNLTEAVLSGSYAIRALAIIFVIRFFIGPWSYAAGTPGGLFAPILALGASFGALSSELMNYLNPNLGGSPLACSVVAMGALFSATVRAPVTGIILSVEMTGRGDLSLGLLSASLAAMVVATLLKSEPIYETL